MNKLFRSFAANADKNAAKSAQIVNSFENTASELEKLNEQIEKDNIEMQKTIDEYQQYIKGNSTIVQQNAKVAGKIRDLIS